LECGEVGYAPGTPVATVIFFGLGKGGRREEGKDLQMRKRNEEVVSRVLNFEMGSNSVTDAILFKFVGRCSCCYYENSEGRY